MSFFSYHEHFYTSKFVILTLKKLISGSRWSSCNKRKFNSLKDSTQKIVTLIVPNNLATLQHSRKWTFDETMTCILNISHANMINFINDRLITKKVDVFIWQSTSTLSPYAILHSGCNFHFPQDTPVTLNSASSVNKVVI